MNVNDKVKLSGDSRIGVITEKQERYIKGSNWPVVFYTVQFETGKPQEFTRDELRYVR